MNKKNLVFVLLGVFLVLLLVLVPAFAAGKGKGKGQGKNKADGTWCYAPLVSEEGKLIPVPEEHEFENDIGVNAFRAISYISEWTGTFTGSSHDNGLVIWQGFLTESPAVFIDLITFDSVEVGGKTGSLEIYAYGERDTEGWKKGPWFITSATDELEGLEGRGFHWPGDEKIECAEGLAPVYYSVEELHGLDFDDDDN
jgi:hypothetical protein